MWRRRRDGIAYRKVRFDRVALSVTIIASVAFLSSSNLDVIVGIAQGVVLAVDSAAFGGIFFTSVTDAIA